MAEKEKRMSFMDKYGFLNQEIMLWKQAKEEVRNIFTKSVLFSPYQTSYLVARKWWRDKFNEETPVLDILENFTDGENFIFFAPSFLLKEENNFVPVPLSVISDSTTNEFIDQCVINSNILYEGVRSGKYGTIKAFSFARALLNLSDSIRYSGAYSNNLIAQSHSSMEYEMSATYIPDITEALKDHQLGIPQSDIISLGMASVLFVPLQIHGVASAIFDMRDSVTTLLMLWSPLVGRWNEHITTEKNRKGIVKFKKDSNFILNLPNVVEERNRNIDNLESYIDFMASYEKLNAGKMTQLLQAVLFSFEDSADPDVRRAIEKVTHKHEKMIRFLVDRKVSRKVTVYQLLGRLFHGSSSVVRVLMHGEVSDVKIPNINDFKTQLIYPDTSIEFDYDDLSDIKGRPYLDLKVQVEESMVDTIVFSPVDNIKKFAKKLLGIDIELYPTLMCIRFKQTMNDETMKRFYEGNQGLLNYYNLRRGFPLESQGEGFGLGNSIFKVLSSQLGLSQRLYFSSDGSAVFDELWIPIA